MLDKNFFNDISLLEPHCPNCGFKIEYGISTSFNDKKGCHICNNCGCELR